MATIDINIKQLHKQEFKEFESGKLMLEFSGKSINNVFVNTLRRLSFDYVPTYAFTKESIFIEKNTSIYNNDMMRLRMSQITVPNIKNSIYFLSEEYWKDIDYSDPNRNRHPEDKKYVEMYINVHNNTKDIMNVTTNDVKLYEDGVQVHKFDKNYPSLIINLNPDEQFICKAVKILGVGIRNNIWAAASNCYYDVDDINNKIKFTIESQGQLDEYEILYKMCFTIQKKLKRIKKNIKNNIKSKIIEKEIIVIKFDDENHTTANIINDNLQNRSDVQYSGCSRIDLLENKINISYVTTNSNKLLPFFETIDFVISMFDHLRDKIINMGKKYIDADTIIKTSVKKKK
jgi:DNA-directed RNA polymerase subunit L